MATLHIAVTGFDGLFNPEPGYGVVRALREGWKEHFEQSLEITALLYTGNETAAWGGDGIDRLFRIPPIADGPQGLLLKLLELNEEASIDVVVPTLDLEISLYSQLVEQLDWYGIRTLVPSLFSLESVRKTQLPIFCHRHSIPTPQTIHLNHLDAVDFYADQLGYPLYVKGTVVGSKLVQNPQEAYQKSLELHGKWGGGVLLQKPVKGDEYVVAVVAGANGSIVGMVPVRKMGVNQLGKGVIGTVVNDPSLINVAKEILSVISWKGALELELIRRNNGKWVLIEINNRFPSWIILSQYAGVNLPILLVKEALNPGGENNKGIDAIPSRSYVRSIVDTNVSFSEWRSFKRHGILHRTKLFENNPEHTEFLGTKHAVAVTGISAFNEVMPGIGVSELLYGHVQLHGLVYGSFDTGAFHPGLFYKTHRIPGLSDREDFFDALVDICAKEEIKVVVPTLDIEIPLYQEYKDKLSCAGIKVLIPPKESLKRRDKKELVMAMDMDQYGHPESIIVRRKKELLDALENLGYPVAVKGPDSGCWYLPHSGMVDTVWSLIPDKMRKDLIVQEWIEGTVYSVAGVCDYDCNPSTMISIHKLIRGDNGETWGAVSVSLPGIEKGISSYLRSIEWVGPFEAEFVRDFESGRYYLIEINPRFPAWIGFAKDIGVNPAIDVIKILHGEKIRNHPVKKEECYFRHCTEYEVTIPQLTRT